MDLNLEVVTRHYFNHEDADINFTVRTILNEIYVT
jgi:hypothetical protein